MALKRYIITTQKKYNINMYQIPMLGSMFKLIRVPSDL